jgi:hypothetical protein
MEKVSNRLLVSSTQPLVDLDRVAYPGQDPMRRMYRSGYEQFFNSLPVMDAADPLLPIMQNQSESIMMQLAEKLLADGWATNEQIPEPNGFNRTILAMQSPVMHEDGLHEGAEIVLARWGEGHTSPVHGHAAGFEHEAILSGLMRINTYRMTNPLSDKVRPVETFIQAPGVFVSRYTAPNPNNWFKRQALIHNFTAVGGPATSLHYLGEHTRDGRDNGFVVEHFEDRYPLTAFDVEQIDINQSLSLRNGEVILVRSASVPYLLDHFIVVTGRPILKPHGLRVQERSIQAAAASSRLLNAYEANIGGVTLLKLLPHARSAFHLFHAISIQNDTVIFPQS